MSTPGTEQTEAADQVEPTGRRSLQRVEAEARAARLTVASVSVELDLTEPGSDTFGSRSTIRFSSTGPETFADFAGRSLTRASLNGVDLDPAVWQRGRLTLTGLQAENVLVVEGVMAYSSDGEGLHRHVDPADQRTYLYAMSFLEAAPRWFACFDQPDLKARYDFTVVAPADWTVLGNGPSVRGDDGRWRIVPPQPLSTYFVTLVAGPYVSVEAEHDGIRLGLHARASLADQLRAEAADMLAVTTACFDYYHRVFGIRYPFGEYHQCFVPDFNAGAMENPGCVTFRDQFLPRGRVTRTDRARRAGVIAHEMAHQWFGDLVTMRWWDDLWLNESFAEYLAHRCCTEVTGYPLWTEFGVVRKDWGSAADQSPSTHPVAGNAAPDGASALQNFDGISYAKGAAVLKQLAAHLGDDVFLAGLRDYVARYSYANATFADLIAAWTRAGATDLDDWATAWLRTTGMDTLDVVGARPTATRPTLVSLPPSPPVAGVPRRPHTVTVGAVDVTGTLTRLAPVALSDAPVPLEVEPGTVLLVPDADDDAWAKIRFGAGGWTALLEVLPRLTDPSAAVVVYNAIRDAVRDASLDPGLALDLLEAGLPSQPDEVVVTALLGFARDQLGAPYCPVTLRAAHAVRVAALVAQVLASSDVGSDRQLAAFRAAVRSETDVDRLLAWSAGEALPDGVVIDPELRWLVVEQIARQQESAVLIEESLRADPSASGRVHAARARAAQPTAEAKAAAWRLVVEPSTVSAYELYATGDGFFDPHQDALTRPYVARYFAEIGATATFREGWVLGQLAGQAFPWTAADRPTLALADACLAGELAPPVRRAVVDGTDRLRRAVAALRRWSPAL